jgi:hypothetical protein
MGGVSKMGGLVKLLPDFQSDVLAVIDLHVDVVVESSDNLQRSALTQTCQSTSLKYITAKSSSKQCMCNN